MVSCLSAWDGTLATFDVGDVGRGVNGYVRLSFFLSSPLEKFGGVC